MSRAQPVRARKRSQRRPESRAAAEAQASRIAKVGRAAVPLWATTLIGTAPRAIASSGNANDPEQTISIELPLVSP